MLILGQNFEVPEQHAMTYWLFASFYLFNPLPCASELIVGLQVLSDVSLRMFLILYIKLKH